MEGEIPENYEVGPRHDVDHWALFLQYVGIGLGFMFINRILIAPREFFGSFLIIFLASWLFTMAAFLFDWLITNRIKEIFHQFIIVYLVFGLIGLLFIEWIMMDNTEFLGWPYLFSLWAGAAVFPKLLLTPFKREEFGWGVGVWTTAIIGIFVSIGGLMYFLMPDYGRGVWMVMMMGLVEALNIVYWREFWLAGKEQKKAGSIK